MDRTFATIISAWAAPAPVTSASAILRAEEDRCSIWEDAADSVRSSTALNNDSGATEQTTRGSTVRLPAGQRADQRLGIGPVL